jgi:hypothetical protein
MIVYINPTNDDLFRRLLEDLQGSGIFLRLTPDDACDAWLNVITPTTLKSMDWQRMREANRFVINVQLSPGDLPKDLPGTTVDLYSNYMTGYRDLIRQLHGVIVSQKADLYQGLLPYGEVEARFFNGRAAFIKVVHEHIANGGRFLALVGASGSGKTSFIRAALMARLRKDGDAWTPLSVTLGDDPIRQLAHRLQPLMSAKSDLVSRLYSNPAALGDVLAEISTGQGKLLLTLDSFENVFTRASLTDRVYFLDVLFDAISRDNGNCVVSLALRADFETRILEYPKWNQLLQANTFVMPELTRDEITEIVNAPAQESGLAIDKALVKRLTDDAMHFNQAALLPALSFLLKGMAGNGKMNVENYEKLGSLGGAVGQYAENLYQGLTPIQQNVARQILLQVIELTEDGKWVVRPIERKRLAFSWASDAEIEHAVAALVGGQLLSSSIEPESGEIILQLSHESLPQMWQRYQEWLGENTESLRYGSHLERLAALWNAREYAEQALLRGSALDEAINWTQNTDHLPSPLLQNYVDVSSEIRRNYEAQQKTRAVRQRGVSLALILSFLAALLVILGGAFLLVRTVGERDNVATLQANAERSLATTTAENQELSVALNAAETTQAESNTALATTVAQYNAAATGQANAQNDIATAIAQAEAQQGTLAAQATTNSASADATIEALVTQQAADAEALANVQNLQSTLDASLQTQQLLSEYIAGQLAQTSSNLAATQPELALQLAAEAGSRILAVDAADTNPMIGQAMRDALKANATFQFKGEIAQTWFINNNNYAVIDYVDAGQADELWALNPPEMVSAFEHPVEQIIPVANGSLFLVDYVDDATDELWRTAEQVVAAQLNGDIAPAPVEADNIEIPNVVQLDNNTFFVLKYEDGLPSELWDVATAERVAALDGDLEAVIPLKDSYFFVRYADEGQVGGIWQTSSGQMVQTAQDIITANYDNGIFALRQDRAYDEIWRTNPFASLTDVVGRVKAVTNLRGTPYFIVQYTGKTPAEIWIDNGDPEIVYKFRGPINNSVTFLNSQYFFIRYDDQTPSEIWSTNPLEVAITLNGHLANNGATPVLGAEEMVIDYEDNAVSEVWSLKDRVRLEVLNGNVKKVLPILGDVFFVVQYEENQPTEIWSAVDAKLIAKLGEENRTVSAVTSLKDGNFLFVLYESEPAELWQVGADGATNVATLPDVTTQVYPFSGDDYVVLNYLNNPAQIWQTGVNSPLVTLADTVSQVAYNRESKRLGLSMVDNESFVINFDRLTQAGDENVILSDTDLLALVCQQLAESEPVSEDLFAAYLGELTPLGCPPIAVVNEAS